MWTYLWCCNNAQNDVMSCGMIFELSFILIDDRENAVVEILHFTFMNKENISLFCKYLWIESSLVEHFEKNGKSNSFKVSEKKGIKINVCGKHEILFQRFCFVASASKLRKMAKQKHAFSVTVKMQT